MKMDEFELYIHIPFCVKKCLYCDFLSGPSNFSEREKYTEAIINELMLYGPRFKGRTLTSIFIGGGTPTFLETEFLIRIVNTVKTEFDLSKDCEITIECNPKTADHISLLKLRECGINRISIGLQSANPIELKTLGRVHNYNDFLRCFEFARYANFRNINVDIITGIPGQTEKSLMDTLKKVTILKPEHISAYDLIIEPGTYFYEKYHEDDLLRQKGEEPHFLPNEDLEKKFTDLTEDFLKKKGYRQYEISNFAKAGYECRHNKGYWERRPYLGVGTGAASFVDEKRWSNERDLYKYIKLLLAPEPILPKVNMTILKKEDSMAEFFYLGLRELEGVSLKKFKEYFGSDAYPIYGDVIEHYQKLGFFDFDGDKLRFTKRGRKVSNYILADFLPDQD